MSTFNWTGTVHVENLRPLKHSYEYEANIKVDIACLSSAIKLLLRICYTFYLEIDTSRDRRCVVTRNTWLESHGSPIFNFWFGKLFRARPRSFLNVNNFYFIRMYNAFCERIFRCFLNCKWQKSKLLFEIGKLSAE